MHVENRFNAIFYLLVSLTPTKLGVRPKRTIIQELNIPMQTLNSGTRARGRGSAIRYKQRNEKKANFKIRTMQLKRCQAESSRKVNVVQGVSIF